MRKRLIPAPGADRPAPQQLSTPMLDALSREYPDLSGHMIVVALDAAITAAEAGDAAGQHAAPARHLVLEIARDRLDLTRARAAAAASRVNTRSTTHECHSAYCFSADTAGDARKTA